MRKNVVLILKSRVFETIVATSLQNVCLNTGTRPENMSTIDHDLNTIPPSLKYDMYSRCTFLLIIIFIFINILEVDETCFPLIRIFLFFNLNGATYCQTQFTSLSGCVK